MLDTYSVNPCLLRDNVGISDQMADCGKSESACRLQGSSREATTSFIHFRKIRWQETFFRFLGVWSYVMKILQECAKRTLDLGVFSYIFKEIASSDLSFSAIVQPGAVAPWPSPLLVMNRAKTVSRAIMDCGSVIGQPGTSDSHLSHVSLLALP
jgi:hypothetical protein